MSKQKTRKTKAERGITLVALIITIIILLILAVVSIRAVTGDGIIQHAKNAKSEYGKAQTNENTTLDGYIAKLDDITKTPFDRMTAENYGDPIEYNDPAGVNDWKVFYKDDNYLYIITSDYLENTKLPNTSDTFPNGLNMSTYSRYPYNAYWENTDAYTSTGASTITSEVANKYMLSWWANSSTSTNNNAKATADLLNTSIWTRKFGDSSKGIEAIGSPTLEMWVASWNEKGYTKLYTAFDEYGYYVGTAENSTSISVSLSSDTAGYADTLYFPHTSEVGGCYAYFLASPCAADSLWVFNAVYNGSVFEISCCEMGVGMRTVVAVPGSLVTRKAADGTLKVAE